MRGKTVGRNGIQHCSGMQSVDVDGDGVVHVERGSRSRYDEGLGKVIIYKNILSEPEI